MLRTAFLLLFSALASLDAQVVETPIAFDSAGKIRSVTPALVERFHLGPPTWPIAGPFVEARLFALSTGGSVLVAQRQDGVMERYPLIDAQRDALREAVDRAMTISGAVVSEEAPTAISQPARGAFVRNQMLLSAIVYGPLLASLTNDGRTATVLYLLSVAGSYFALSSLPKTMVVTRAQNHLATDGGVRGYFFTNGLLVALGGTDLDYKVYNGIGLLGSLGMSVIGFNRARNMTDSDANATTKLSTLSAAAAFGALGTLGQLNDDGDEHLAAGAVVAAGITGYLAGPVYPCRASYTVTSGDVSTLMVGALLGTAAGVTPFVDYDADEQPVFAAATAGGVLGVLLADRLLVRPFDYGSADVTQLWLGTLAGALVGTAAAVMTQPPPVAVSTLVTGGAIAGAVAGHHLANPPRARPRQARLEGASLRVGKSRLRLEPAGIALAARGVRGQHAILSMQF